MRVLLRNRRTTRYYVGPNEPGTGQERAVDFGNVGSAARFTLEEKLPDMEIILRYDLCDSEISLPVLAEWFLSEERALRSGADPVPPGDSVLGASACEVNTPPLPARGVGGDHCL